MGSSTMTFWKAVPSRLNSEPLSLLSPTSMLLCWNAKSLGWEICLELDQVRVVAHRTESY